MRELNVNEANQISGGLRDADRVIADIAMLTAASIIMAGYIDTPTPYYTYQPVINETYTPVYDTYGRYQGNMIDSYITYEPVMTYYY